MVLSGSPTLGARDLPPEIRETAETQPAGPLSLKSHESRLIREALKRHSGNRRRTAAALHIGTVTLWRKMKQYGIKG